MRASNYDKFPAIPVPVCHARSCWTGWTDIASRLRQNGGRILAVDCYPGVHDDDLRRILVAEFQPALTVDTKELFISPAEVEALVAPCLGGDDPVFGRLSDLQMDQFLSPEKVARARSLMTCTRGPVLVVGPGASLVAPPDSLLVYADLPRWEGQLRQRRGTVDNLGTRNRGLRASLQYKRSYFVDWRVADRLKQATMSRWDFLLDTTAPAEPKLITGEAHLAALATAVARPFRVVPFFDPGPWGGQWMRRVCDLPDGPPNYAWCFDCVPEENSLLLEFAGGVRVEIPASNLVFNQPAALLGPAVHARFGAEFPIRFDLLDTMGGGNLSLQVHPTPAYAREHFGLGYTQDESYYLLDAEPGASVFLGRKTEADFPAMMAALAAAQAGGPPFPAEKFAARLPARKHDHFLIPAGTLHCSGAGAMVLEVSATPYIFTFKLWDWNRLGLDGRPRPVNLARGREVLDWSRDEEHARRHLVNQVREVTRGPGWAEERTGLHDGMFIETRRHWFTDRVPHATAGTVNVLNLVEGSEAVVESPDHAFAPFIVHYAETFILPAAVGTYTIRPAVAGSRCATLKAYVRQPG